MLSPTICSLAESLSCLCLSTGWSPSVSPICSLVCSVADLPISLVSLPRPPPLARPSPPPRPPPLARLMSLAEPVTAITAPRGTQHTPCAVPPPPRIHLRDTPVPQGHHCSVTLTSLLGHTAEHQSPPPSTQQWWCMWHRQPQQLSLGASWLVGRACHSGTDHRQAHCLIFQHPDKARQPPGWGTVGPGAQHLRPG